MPRAVARAARLAGTAVPAEDKIEMRHIDVSPAEFEAIGPLRPPHTLLPRPSGLPRRPHPRRIAGPGARAPDFAEPRVTVDRN